MIFDFCNKLLESHRDICNRLEDITGAMNGTKSSKRFFIMPYDKKRRNFILRVLDIDTQDDIMVFIGQHTIGVKQYSKGHIPVCEFSVSRKENVQIVSLKYPDETGIEQTSTYDPDTKVYSFDSSTISLLAQDFLEGDNYQDFLLAEDTPVGVFFQKDPNDPVAPFMGIKRSLKVKKLEDLYSIQNEFEESLQRLTEYIRQNQMTFIQAYTTSLSFVCPNDFGKRVSQLKKAFEIMVKNLEKQQGIYPDNAIPDEGER